MNFHLNSGVYFRREGDKLRIVRAASFNDPGELIIETDIDGFASIIASFSPFQEQAGSWNYARGFLLGTMLCRNCGGAMTEAKDIVHLSILGPVCLECFVKWKAAFGV